MIDLNWHTTYTTSIEVVFSLDGGFRWHRII